jgi:glycosyltransferase involved in cell wall biosynthesis
VRIATLANASVIHTRRWVEHFRARGHEVRLWSLEPGPPELEAERLPAVPLPGLLRYPLAVPALRAGLARWAPDLVDAHYVPNYGLIATLAGARPRAVTAWGSDLLVAGSANAAQRARARFVLGAADAVLADSANLAAAARALGAPAGRVHEIPWGVDLERFPRADALGEGAAATAREPGLLLSTRMHEPVYDLPTLFRGVAPLLAERADLRLVVAGDGHDRAALERLAGTLLPRERVRFVGMLSPRELAGWLLRAEISLSASRSDSTSVSLLEAMAAGAIPVVSDLEGNREWVADGAGARLFRTGDPGSLTAALRAALADPGWRAAARAANRAVIEARGSWSVNLGRVEALFESLVAARRRGVAR